MLSYCESKRVSIESILALMRAQCAGRQVIFDTAQI